MKYRVLSKILLVIILALLWSCSAKKNLRIGDVSYEIGEYSSSIEKYRKAYKSKKTADDKPLIAFRIAEAYYQIGDYRKAVVWFKNAIKRQYTDSLAMLHYAHCLRATEKYEDAITWYLTYLDISPDDLEAQNGLEACKEVGEWLEKPSRYIVNPVRELNTKESDYCPVYFGDKDNEIVFTSTRELATGRRKSSITGQRFADIFYSKFGVQKQKWGEAKLIEEEGLINTEDDEGAVTIGGNGSQIIFTRCRYDKTQDIGAELYEVSQSRGEWAEPIRLEIFGDSLSTAHPALSAKGDTLYFVSDKPGGYGGNDIWYATKTGEGFGNAVNMGPGINTPGEEMFPFIRKTGELYFSSDYYPGIGGLDIFKATKDQNGEWVVENLKAPINSPGDDFGICFLAGEVEKGMFSSNRKGARMDDIYSFYLPPKVFNVSGEIYDKETGQKVDGAQLRAIGTDGMNLKMRASNGRFQIKLKPETEYIFAGFKDGYLNDKVKINTIGLEDSKDFKVVLNLTPTDAPIKIDNIYYEFGKWDLLQESLTALDSLVRILELNPTVTIELMSHTDFVGSDQFNFQLSQKRAESVMNYLIKKGIDPDRMVAKGYGETWPKKVTKQLAGKYEFLNKGDELTEEFISKLPFEEQEIAKAINRRTEFRVLSTDFHKKYKAEVEQ